MPGRHIRRLDRRTKRKRNGLQGWGRSRSNDRAMHRIVRFLSVGGWGPSAVEVAAATPPVDLGSELAL
jgi:hypothetical protein